LPSIEGLFLLTQVALHALELLATTLGLTLQICLCLKGELLGLKLNLPMFGLCLFLRLLQDARGQGLRLGYFTFDHLFSEQIPNDYTYDRHDQRDH
jgi:hypothetical protein